MLPVERIRFAPFFKLEMKGSPFGCVALQGLRKGDHSMSTLLNRQLLWQPFHLAFSSLDSDALFFS